MSTASKTAEQSQQKNFRLPAHVVPARYEITLRPDLPRGTFSGSEKIDLHVLEPTSTVVLNALELTLIEVKAVSNDGTTLEGAVSLDEETQLATITFAGILGPGPWSLAIDFAGKLGDQLKGFYRSTWVDSAGGKHFIASTHFEPTHARRAFPCWDEPAFKATFQISLEVDAKLTVISNGSLESEQLIDSRSSNGRRGSGAQEANARKLVRFNETIPMSTYLIAFVVGELVSSEAATVNGTDVSIWCVPGKEHLTDFAQKAALFAIDFYERYFEIPYPGNKIDHVAIPDFPIGAMENFGCITFRETALLIDEKLSTHAALVRVAEVVMHELAHMWFGDLVTMHWWNGLWLKESFATFMANICLHAWKPEWQVWDQFSLSRAAAFETDALASTHPIESRVNHPDEATEMFDVISYQKGCAVLYQLYDFVGAELFRKGCVRYLQSHSYRNTETHDLWDALEETCRAEGVTAPVREIMDAWVFSPGHPVVELTEENGDGFIRVRQKPFHLLPQDGAPALLPLPLTLRILSDEKPAQEKRILVRGDETLVYVGENHGAIIANSGGAGFYRVVYGQSLMMRLRANLLGVLRPVERFNLVNDSWSSVRAGITTVENHLKLVSLFVGETDTNVWEAIVHSLEHISWLVDEKGKDSLAQLVRKLMGPTLERIGWRPQDGEDTHTRNLRGIVVRQLGTTGRDTDVKSKAEKTLAAWRKDGTSVSSELLQAVLMVSAYNGTARLYDELLELAGKAVNPQEVVRYLFALARFQDKALIERTVKLSLSDKVRAQDAPSLLATVLGNQAGAKLAWQYIKDNFPAMQARYAELAMARMCGSLSHLDTPEQASDVRAFFATHKVRAGESAVRQMLEQLQINERLRTREAQELPAALTRSLS